MQFEPSSQGLYYYDFKESLKRKMVQEHNALVVNTVEETQRKFTKREVERQRQQEGHMLS
jgi:hypothetical protein